MNQNRTRLASTLLTSCMVGALMFTTLTSHANAAETAHCVGPYNGLDARLAARADQGAPALRNFVFRTRAIHQLDVTEAVARVDRYRKSVDNCGK